MVSDLSPDTGATPLPLSVMVLAYLKRPPVIAVLAAIAVSAIVIIVLTFRWFLNPHSVTPDRVDAVVVLAGGQGERLDRAMELMEQPVADTFVLSVGNEKWNDSEAIAEACAAQDPPIEVVCFVPIPDSTAGEAKTFADLAEQRGWQRVALVTSEYHLHRATLWFERCFDGEVLPVAAPAGTGLGLLTHEWFGTLEAQILDRSCE